MDFLLPFTGPGNVVRRLHPHKRVFMGMVFLLLALVVVL
jgi:hypothetical protein